MSQMGQSRHFGRRPTTSGLPLETDIVGAGRHVSKVPIVLKKSFWGDERKFLEPLMRFACGDMRDHIVSHKNDHGASYRRYGVSPWRSRLKINFCEMCSVVRFSTFDKKSTGSPQCCRSAGGIGQIGAVLLLVG